MRGRARRKMVMAVLSCLFICIVSLRGSAEESVEILLPEDNAPVEMGSFQVKVQYTCEGPDREIAVYLKKGEFTRRIGGVYASLGSHEENIDVNTRDVIVGTYQLVAALRYLPTCETLCFDSINVRIWTYYALDVMNRSSMPTLGTLGVRFQKVDLSWITVKETDCVTTGVPQQIHTPNTYCTNGDTPPIDWKDLGTNALVCYEPYRVVDGHIIGKYYFVLPSPITAPCGCQRVGILIHGGAPTGDPAVAMLPYQTLCMTHGCIRLYNATLEYLAQLWDELVVSRCCKFKVHVP